MRADTLAYPPPFFLFLFLVLLHAACPSDPTRKTQALSSDSRVVYHCRALFSSFDDQFCECVVEIIDDHAWDAWSVHGALARENKCVDVYDTISRRFAGFTS